MTAVDVAVIGLGVYGSAVADALARCGRRVLAVEQSGADEVGGASQGPVRMLRTHDPDRPELDGLARRAARQWRALSAAQPSPLLRAVAGVFVRPPAARPLLAASGRPSLGSRDRSLPAGHPLRLPLAVPAGWEVAGSRGCGLLDARAAVLALRERARAHGATLLFGRRAELATRAPEEPVRISVGDRRVTAARLLICVGAWSTGLPAWARVPGLRVEPTYMQVATFAEAALGGSAYYVFGHGDERFCAIPLTSGGLQFGHFAQPAAASSPPDRAEASWRRDAAALARFVPDLGPALTRSTVAGCYSTPPGGAFTLRWASPYAATLVACSGVGFKYAPAVAELVVAALDQRLARRPGLRVEAAR
ncbi:NAD(P)/FAD-dependent oxidoreductase [Catellatospora methionotrophica]|nr:FAD-dependent oxidoreductase [Catellatospora methionotrophica]